MIVINGLVNENLTKAQKVMKKQYDKRANAEILHSGDIVFIQNIFTDPSKDKKLSPKWIGPYTVDGQINKLCYQVRNISDDKKL